MPIARKRDAEAGVENDELADTEVPATVVCAHCRDVDCPGCFDERTRSGIVAIVPWERPGAHTLGRLWATARATTLDAERFFELLPDGPVAPALKFAIASEMIAAAAMMLVLLIPLAGISPGWVYQLLFRETATAVHFAAVGIPGLAGILVGAHIAHGWALDYGARRSGAPAAMNRALRFGLYAAGWDLVIGPLGIIVLACKEGASAALSIAGVGMGLPGRSARAFLRGCYRLEGEAAVPAVRTSYIAAAVSTTVGAVAIIAGIVVAMLS